MTTEPSTPALSNTAARLAGAAADAVQAMQSYTVHTKASIADVIAYGRALSVGREIHASDQAFKRWVASNNLDTVKPFNDRKERHAAMRIAEAAETACDLDLATCPYSRPTDIMKWVRKQVRGEVAAKAEPKPSLKDSRIAELEAEVAALKTRLASADNQTIDLEGKSIVSDFKLVVDRFPAQPRNRSKLADMRKILDANIERIDAALKARVAKLYSPAETKKMAKQAKQNGGAQ